MTALPPVNQDGSFKQLPKPAVSPRAAMKADLLVNRGIWMAASLIFYGLLTLPITAVLNGLMGWHLGLGVVFDLTIAAIVALRVLMYEVANVVRYERRLKAAEDDTVQKLEHFVRTVADETAKASNN